MTVLSSLTNRIFVASALLVAASIGLAVYRVNEAITAQAESELQTGLDDSAKLVDDFSRTQFADFVRLAAFVADLPKLKASAATDDPPTVQPIAGDYQRTLGTDLFIVLGRTDRVLANTGAYRPSEPEIARMLADCRKRPDATAFQPYAGGLLHTIALPLEAGSSPAGTLLAGFTLGPAFVARIKTVTKSDIVLMSGPRVLASTLDERRTAALTEVPSRAGTFVRTLDGEEFVGQVQQLAPSPEPDEPLAIVLRSRTERLRFLPPLQWQLAVTGLLVMLVSTVIGYTIARTVTGPVRALTATMRDMAATGDLTREVPEGGRWDDEDARLLAGTFRQLTTALARFRREAAQRERLSALGRLSTVVAHEIRNPLMIIKSAARSLRKQTSPGVVEIAASIDEEVQRLNGVVTDVLDFARPLRFELTDADLLEVCREAARAAQAGPGDAAVTVECDATRAPVVTDVVRLRSVLVNLVTNSQHALRARPAGVSPVPAIRVRIQRGLPDRWQIDVIDLGIGIPADDLPRLFEPFFTTRQSGVGLGLALARNIIEGLGGTIGARSRPHEGTTVSIELPDQTLRTEVRA